MLVLSWLDDGRPGTDCATCRIVEQTYRGCEFWLGGTYFVANNGIKLQSCDSPAWDGHHKRLFVRGSDVSRDRALIDVPCYLVGQLMDAVREYNNARYGKEVVPGVEYVDITLDSSMGVDAIPNAWEVPCA